MTPAKWAEPLGARPRRPVLRRAWSRASLRAPLCGGILLLLGGSGAAAVPFTSAVIDGQNAGDYAAPSPPALRT